MPYRCLIKTERMRGNTKKVLDWGGSVEDASGGKDSMYFDRTIFFPVIYSLNPCDLEQVT